MPRCFLTLAVALVFVTQAGAAVLLSDDFEDATHTAGDPITNANGWTGSSDPLAILSAPGLGLSGQAADGTSGGIVSNPAGVGSGPGTAPKLVLSWDWLINSGESTGGNFKFTGSRIVVEVRSDVGLLRLLDPQDISDTDVAFPGGPGEQVINFRLEADQDFVEYYVNDNLELTSPMQGTYGNIDGISWNAGGYIDNVNLSAVPEPASLSLLALGGLVLLARRRRR